MDVLVLNSMIFLYTTIAYGQKITILRGGGVSNLLVLLLQYN